MSNIPRKSYGILQQNLSEGEFDDAAEQVRNLGYTVIDSGFSALEIEGIAVEFDRTRHHYVEKFGEAMLKSIDEFYTIRSPLTHGGEEFLRLALNVKLLALLKKLIRGEFILNQQNGVINPPQTSYNQGAWHRDLPYQHFVSSSPLAINALYCVDDFTLDNGSTFVLPASHKAENFPSATYVQKNAVQVEARAGSYIVLDCMAFHCGGENSSSSDRRAVNQSYSIPYFKQQINIPNNIQGKKLSAEEQKILGYNYLEPGSIEQYLATRAGK
jgi:hypothetical protein